MVNRAELPRDRALSANFTFISQNCAHNRRHHRNPDEHAREMSKKTPDWTTEQSAEMYGIRDWGNSYFDVSTKGEVVINLRDGNKTKPISLPDIVRGMRERGM